MIMNITEQINHVILFAKKNDYVDHDNITHNNDGNNDDKNTTTNKL